MQNKRPLVFLAVGVVNTVLDFLFFTFLTQVVFRDASQIGLAGIISGTFSLICALITHSLITWRGAKISPITILKFVVFTGIGMWAIRPTLLALFIHLTSLYAWVTLLLHQIQIPMSYAFVSNTGAFGFMVIIVLIYNYLVYNSLVFTNRKTSESTDTADKSR